MLKPEDARAQLADLKATNPAIAPIERCRDWPPDLAAAYLQLCGIDKNGKPVRLWAHDQKWRKSANFLCANADQRDVLFRELFGPIAPQAEATWRLFDRLPYPRGGGRRAFRAPTRPEAGNERRGDWLFGFAHAVRGLPEQALDPAWLAAWAIHLGVVNEIGYFLAAVIDSNDPRADEIVQILKDSAASEHDIGGMGAHVCRALLCCARPEAWEYTGKLLLAAQRQEGLRQTILESVDEAHPGAFRHMLKLVREEDLIRFASVVRATGVWLGQAFDTLTPAKVKAALQIVETMLENRDARAQAVDKGTIEECRTALWCYAFEDVTQLLEWAPRTLQHADPERRLAMLSLLWQTGLPELMDMFLPLLDDADLRVVSIVLGYFGTLPHYGGAGVEHRWEGGKNRRIYNVPAPANLFERLESLIDRLPAEPVKLKMDETGIHVVEISKASAADLLNDLLDARPAERLLPHFAVMGDYGRTQALGRLSQANPLAPAIRDLLLASANDANNHVRDTAVELIAKLSLTTDELLRLEAYLERKAEKVRLGLFKILMRQNDDGVLASIDRLLQASELNQRLAGIELGRQMQVAKRQVEAVHARMVAFSQNRRLRKDEADALKPVLVPPAKQWTLDDGLGLFDPLERTTVTPPVKQDVHILSKAGGNLVRDLDEFIHRAKDMTYTVAYPNGAKQEYVLGSNPWYFPQPIAGVSAEADRKNLPLFELWQEWWDSRSDSTRDQDGLELIRAIWHPLSQVREGEEFAADEEYDDDFYDDPGADPQVKANADTLKDALEKLIRLKSVRVRYNQIVTKVLAWFFKLQPPEGMAEFGLDALETIFASVPERVIAVLPTLAAAANRPENADRNGTDWRISVLGNWSGSILQLAGCPGWTSEHDARLYRLLHWLDQPISGARRCRPALTQLLKAYAAKACSRADLYDDLVGPKGVTSRWYYNPGHESLRSLTTTGRDFADWFEKYPDIKQVLDRCVERVLEVELGRGEAPTVATPLANAISSLQGADVLVRLLTALGKSGFSRRFESWQPLEAKAAVLTRLVRVTRPAPDDQPKDFAARAKALIKEGAFKQDLIVELGLLNPYWLSHAEAAIGWAGYSEAVWWFIAHIPNPFDIRVQEGEEIDEEYNHVARQWQAIVKARTNLTPEQRYEGIVDVAWFHNAYRAVGSAKHWDAIEEASKFLHRGQVHKRAARLADVLLGTTKKKDLIDGIRKKNLKEYVRLLGLLPLPEEGPKRQGELRERYRVLKEYERYAKGLSSLSKEPALRSVRQGLENLAVTAGLADPMRLEWYVTREYVEDLLKGPVVVNVKDVQVTLSLSPQAEPEIAQTKKDKPLKSVPPEVKKAPKVAELFERRTDLKRMAASTKLSLEMAMCRGDAFTGRELQELMQHALVRPLLERLVLQHDGGKGYPVKDGKALENYAGKSVAVKAGDAITIAHPLDLLANKDWHHWQKDCFARERLQPFKQVFREIYVATKEEEAEGDRSRRYAGQQLNPQQAMALLGQRGWSTREGVEKLFRDEGIIAEVHFNHGYATPAEVEAPTLELVGFRRRDSWTLLALKKVPKRTFSEVMRDLDLVVSVAHVGGVDPESSASTIDMRAALLKETLSLLGIKSVKLDSRHALIKGTLGHYSVHLGSGVVHKQPGGALCIIPVHAQQRGRLFLPFADNDPKTAEVISKILLLARDNEIQDPTILQQIAQR